MHPTAVRAHPAKSPRKPSAQGGVVKPDRDPLRLALAALVILSVSRLHQHFAALAAVRALLLLVAFTGLYAFLNPKKIAPANLQLKPARLVMLMAVWACITVPFGISLGGSAVFILNSYSKTILLCFLLIVAIRGPRDLLTIVWSYVIGCGVLAYFALFVFGLSKASDTDMARLAGMATFDANDMGLVLLIGLALSILTYQVSSTTGKVVSALTMAGIGGALARSGSRGAFVGLVVVGAALMFMLRSVPITKRLGFVLVTLIGLSIAAPSGYWSQMKTIAAPTKDYNWDAEDGRRAVAERGIGYMLGYPIFGLGIQNFWRAECFMSEKAVNRIIGHGIRCTPPHNSYIQAGAETGIPGLIIWSSIVFGGILGANRLRKRLPKHWERGDPEERFLFLASMYIPLAMIAFAVTSFFLSFAWIDMLYMVTAMITGLYACVGAKLPDLDPALIGAPRRPPRPGSKGMAVPGRR
jgi:O-antigen ligase